MLTLPPLSPTTRIVDAVYESLRRNILDGTLKSGTQLSVPELSRRLEVSRSPVREAVLQLVADGLAVEQPRKGVVVATVGIDDLIELHEIREYTEALVARLAAERASADDLAQLTRILDEQASAVAHNDSDGYFNTNAAFHARLGEASGNRRLVHICNSLEGQMRIGLMRVSEDMGQRQRGLAEHQAILKAVRTHDAPLAEELMRKHIAMTRANLAALSPQHLEANNLILPK